MRRILDEVRFLRAFLSMPADELWRCHLFTVHLSDQMQGHDEAMRRLVRDERRQERRLADLIRAVDRLQQGTPHA